MDARTRNKALHCKRVYKQMNFRVRRQSALYERMEAYLSEGETSLNLLITRALCEYLKCELPHRQYSTYTRHRII